MSCSRPSIIMQSIQSSGYRVLVLFAELHKRPSFQVVWVSSLAHCISFYYRYDWLARIPRSWLAIPHQHRIIIGHILVTFLLIIIRAIIREMYTQGNVHCRHRYEAACREVEMLETPLENMLQPSIVSNDMLLQFNELTPAGKSVAEALTAILLLVQWNETN